MHKTINKCNNIFIVKIWEEKIRSKQSQDEACVLLDMPTWVLSPLWSSHSEITGAGARSTLEPNVEQGPGCHLQATGIRERKKTSRIQTQLKWFLLGKQEQAPGQMEWCAVWGWGATLGDPQQWPRRKDAGCT